MIHKFLVLAIIFATLGGCGSLERKPAPYEPEMAKLPNMDVDIHWARKLPDQGLDRYADVQPNVAGESVFVVEEGGSVTRFSSRNGVVEWRSRLGKDISAGPEVVDNQIFIGTRNAEVISLDVETGKLNWQVTVSSEVISAPKQAGDVLIVHSVDGNIVGLNAQNGSPIWTFSRQVPILTLRGTGVPLVVDDKVVVGLSNGKMVALSVLDGKMLWESVISLPQGRSELERVVDIDGKIRYDDGTLYVVGFQGRVAAVTIESGRLLWTRDMSSFLGLNFDDRNLYITDADGKIWALNKENGATLWMQDKLQEMANTVVARYNDKLVVGDYHGNLYWLASSDGRVLGKYTYLELIERTGILNPADPEEAKEKFIRSNYVDDFGAAGMPQVIGNKLLVSYRSGVVAYLSLK